MASNANAVIQVRPDSTTLVVPVPGFFDGVLATVAADAAATHADRVAADADAAAITAAVAAGNLTNATVNVGSRTLLSALATSLPAYLSEAGREGTFVWNGANLSAFVSADSRQGIYVAPSSDPSGTSGAWVRRFSGPINAAWFGLVEGDNSANGAGNTVAITALMNTLAARRSVYGASVENGVERVLIPYGIYWFGDAGAGVAIEITSTIILEGHSSSLGNAAPILKFPAGVTGIRVQGEQTSGALTKDGAQHNGAQGTTLRNLSLTGSFTTTEAEAHGVVARTTIRCVGVLCRNFQGDGFHVFGSTGAASGANPPYGNVNECSFLNCAANGNRNGLYFKGTDANACTIIGFHAQANRQAGIYDSSFLGNSYFGGQLTSNGTSAGNDGVNAPVAVVSQGGNIYGVIAGQEVGASTNAPTGTATDNTWWYYISAGVPGTGQPAWFSGISCRAGGPVLDDSANSVNIYTGVYAENGGAKAQIAQRSIVVGGFLSTWLYQSVAANWGTGAIRSTNNGVVETDTAWKTNSGDVVAQLGTGQGNLSRRIFQATYTPAGSFYNLKFHASSLNLRFDVGDSDSAVIYWLTGANTTSQFGTGAAFPYAFSAPALMVGGNSFALTNARHMMIDTAPPTTGAHAQGEIVFNRNAAVGSPKGWQCTVAGTPGTWVSMGNL